ncbi:4Fe-4S binding protein [Undibacterium parvum]|uniref:4Fe-4S dicluster domain-containing protein n=1 Tax=Undibacterium parvum TaxID=401471 RepID=A0A3Q9BSL4_9BURK|nr:4Fe-4S binding protein [Undibacterium parvum]AZP13077.1 4Fe-4S dicluster domain-containing protein [Undibacterium parvum]
MSTQFKICSCNKTMPLDADSAAALKQSLGTTTLTVSDALCRREAGVFLDAIKGSEDVVVACTQERALFSELAQQSVAPLRFVNIREAAGWSRQSNLALPKMAALLAAAALPDPEPVPTVSYRSGGNLLIIGGAQAALAWAKRLATQLDVNVLITEGVSGSERLTERGFPVFSGAKIAISGHLGAFNVEWQQANPIDLESCTRCNACVEVCPENAIDFSYQIDLNKCSNHLDCVKACGAIGAIDFNRKEIARNSAFDLILDLSVKPLLSMSQPPQGYFAPGKDLDAQFDAVLRLTQMVGEFEKPKFFTYKEKLCAHSRSAKTGCNACIDVCSTAAISSKGDKVLVDPNLCAGCGACTTVCPTGAMSYAYLRPADQGLRLKTLLSTYAKAGGKAPALLFHSKQGGAELLLQTGQNAAKKGRGLPAHVIPVDLHHTASLGIDLWMAAIAFGASNIAVLMTDEEAQEYRQAVQNQMEVAQTILTGLGYAGQHFHLIQAETVAQLDQALFGMQQAQTPAVAALFNVAAEKRGTLDFALEHLYKHAPVKAEEIALPRGKGAMYGEVRINKDACTLCMSCVGACPSSALMDNANAPQLRFIERNCVQCGLCEQTCPENAIQLLPRLLLTDVAREARVLNEAQAFHCIKCQTPFATAKMMETMLLKLAGHGAFSGNLDRLKMCSDCRVIDMMQTKELSRPH